MTALEDLGFRTVAAGPDIKIGDREGFYRHGNPDRETLRAELAARRSRGWMASKATLDELRREAEVAIPSTVPSHLSTLFGIPVYLDEAVPVGYLRPVYIERMKEGS